MGWETQRDAKKKNKSDTSEIHLNDQGCVGLFNSRTPVSVCMCVWRGGMGVVGVPTVARRGRGKDGLLGTCVPLLDLEEHLERKKEVMKRRFSLYLGPMRLFVDFLISHSSTNLVLRVAGSLLPQANAW